MNPTPEQVAQWAREAGLQDFGHGFSSFRPCDNSIVGGEFVRPTMADLHRLVTRAMAEQAEFDAKLCAEKVDAEYATGKVDHNEMAWTQACAIVIRANAPKVTT